MQTRQVYAAEATISPKNIFDPVKYIPADKRVAYASTLYKKTFRKKSIAVAMANLDTLNLIAVDLDDLPLQCAVFDMRADYFSVNRGFNPISTNYYQQAIDFAAENKLAMQMGLYLHKMGLYYFTFKRNASACQYFLRSQEIFSSVGYDKIPNINIYLSEVASFYYYLGDYDNARVNLVAAVQYTPDGSRDKINIINTIGLIYRNYQQFPTAINYFTQALNIARATKDTVWVGIAQGNIGSVYFLQKQYDKALPYIITDYKTSITYNEPVNGAIALLRLVKINIDRKNFKIASLELDTAGVLLTNTKEDALSFLVNYYDLRSELAEETGKIGESIAFRKIYEHDKDSLARRDNLTSVERVKLRWEVDKRSALLKQLEANEKVQKVEIYATIAVLVLLVVISILIYNRYWLKTKKDKELLIAEKRIVDEELKSAGTALHGFTENLKEKNVIIEKFRREIDKLNQQSTNNANAGQLEKLLQAHIMTDDNWNDFRKLFSKVHPGFFINLTKNYPQLSSTDTRMLALIKLGLNNTEMANMLGITVEGIKKAKQRLRKKVDIETVFGMDDDGVDM